MTDEELKAKLGADVYDALMAKIQPAKAQSEWQALALGAVKSWTNWFGAVLIAWPAIQPQVQPLLEQVVGPKNTGWFVSLVGVAVILFRFKTTQSIKDKGA